jgi:hypothetical protein
MGKELKRILEKARKDKDVCVRKEKVQEWATLALSLKAEAFTEESRESWKWMSREYAEKKLGLS